MKVWITISFIVGFAIAFLFFKPETIEKEVTVETIKTDTVYIEVRDTIIVPYERIRTVSLRDTVILNRPYPLNRFSGLEPVLYGDVGYSGLVAGHLLNIDLTTNFRIPEITNTIHRETTKTVIQKAKGLYGTGGINSKFNFSVGATYLNDKSLIGYEYQPQINVHSVKVGFKLF